MVFRLAEGHDTRVLRFCISMNPQPQTSQRFGIFRDRTGSAGGLVVVAVLLLVSGLGSDVRHASLQVKYLDIDHSDPNDLKFDYNMRLFKNVPKLYLTL